MPTKEQLEDETIQLRIKLVECRSEIRLLNNKIDSLNIKIKKMRQTIDDKDDDINRLQKAFKKLEDVVF